MSLKIEGLAVTHAGRVRRNNEDNYFLFGAFREDVRVRRQCVEKTALADRMLAAVYDGMGGEEAGETASLLAAQTFRPCRLEQAAQEAVRQVQEANLKICTEADRLGIGRMGTTVAALYLDRDTAVSCNVGDSRCYLFRGGRLERLSTDHSEAQRMMDMGFLDETEARKSRGWHMLTQHLGISPDELLIEPCLSRSIPVKPGDLFLLCSDGLTDPVTDDELEELLRDQGGLKEKADALLQKALDRGGRDNITLILLQADEQERKAETGLPGDGTAEGGAAKKRWTKRGTDSRIKGRTAERRFRRRNAVNRIKNDRMHSWGSRGRRQRPARRYL